MKKISLFIFTIIVISSCQVESKKELLEADSIQIAESKADNFNGKIPPDLEVFEIAMFTDEYSLEDMHNYYKNEIPLHHQKSYFNNLKSFAITGLVNHGIIEKGDSDMIQYYIAQQMALVSNTSNLKDFPKFLERMKGEWSRKQIQDYMELYIAKNRKNLERYKDSENLEESKAILLELDLWSKEL